VFCSNSGPVKDSRNQWWCILWCLLKSGSSFKELNVCSCHSLTGIIFKRKPMSANQRISKLHKTLAVMECKVLPGIQILFTMSPSHGFVQSYWTVSVIASLLAITHGSLWNETEGYCTSQESEQKIASTLGITLRKVFNRGIRYFQKFLKNGWIGNWGMDIGIFSNFSFY
jgi:hypothetical protein